MKHKDDESRKVFDKIRKGYPVYRRELNNPNVESVEHVETQQSKHELIKKADEEIEKLLQKGGKLDGNAFVHSKLKMQAKKR